MSTRYKLVRGRGSSLRTPVLRGAKFASRLISLPTNFEPPTVSLPVADAVSDVIGNPDWAFSFTVTSTGGNSPYTWTLSSGTLPAGLSLNSSTGEISGTPTGVETQTGIILQVEDLNMFTALTNSFQIDIVATNDFDETFDTLWDGI